MSPAACYSLQGRSSPARMVLVLAIVAAILWALREVAWAHDLLPAWLAGGLAGAAIAKAVAEGVRRLHDIGLSGHVGGWIALAFGVAFAGSLAWAEAEDVNGMMPLAWSTAAALLALAVWPARRSAIRYGEGPAGLATGAAPGGTAGLVLAALLIAVGAAGAATLAWFLDDVRDNARRNAAIAASRYPQGDAPAPAPAPAAPEPRP